MNLLERLNQVLSAAVSMAADLRQLKEALTQTRQEVAKLTADNQELRERVLRLETLRDADRAQMAAELSRFKIEFERAELRLTRMLPKGTDPAE